MATADVVTRGFGSFSSVNKVVTAGYDTSGTPSGGGEGDDTAPRIGGIDPGLKIHDMNPAIGGGFF